MYEKFNVDSIENFIANFKIVKTLNDGLLSIFHNTNKELVEITSTQNSCERELKALLVQVEMKKSEKFSPDKKTSIISQDLENKIRELKDNISKTEDQYNKKEENLSKIVNFLLSFDIKMQYLMNIINVFEVKNASSLLVSPIKNHVGEKRSSNSLKSVINACKINSKTQVLKQKQNTSTNQLIVHIKLKSLKNWNDQANIKAILQFILNFQWKVNYLANMIFYNFLQKKYGEKKLTQDFKNKISFTIEELLDPKLQSEYDDHLQKFYKEMFKNKRELKEKEGNNKNMKKDQEKNM